MSRVQFYNFLLFASHKLIKSLMFFLRFNFFPLNFALAL